MLFRSVFDGEAEAVDDDFVAPVEVDSLAEHPLRASPVIATVTAMKRSGEYDLFIFPPEPVENENTSKIGASMAQLSTRSSLEIRQGDSTQVQPITIATEGICRHLLAPVSRTVNANWWAPRGWASVGIGRHARTPLPERDPGAVNRDKFRSSGHVP